LSASVRFPDGEALTEMPTLFVAPPVMLTSGVLVVVGLVCGCVGRQLVCSDVFKETTGLCP
jgi:hypothetical protein